jgi:integrase
MASVVSRGSRWYVKYRDHRGKWVRRPTTARTKTEARRLADDVERRCERQRLGLEPIPDEAGGGTLGELAEWWLKTYSVELASHQRNTFTLGKHLLASSLAELRLVDVTPGVIEQFLQAKVADLGPQSLNHLRMFLMSMFSAAKKAGKFEGANPAKEVQRRKVPRRMPEYLRTHEVPVVLAHVPRKWQPLFATAIYTGLRRGELLGLRKQDVDLDARLLTVARSYDHDTTKGGHADVIPIAKELVPFLREALTRSPSELVFPAPDGTMFSQYTPLEEVLRRAMKHAGIVLGYEHVCRKKGCTHAELASDATIRHCPEHGMKLWPKAKVRPIRFHDLRHTTASLLMMAGANAAAVQRILRHSDPRITTEVYGHLAPGYLRAEVDRLQFFPQQETVAEVVPLQVAVAVGTSTAGPAESVSMAETAPLGPMVVQNPPKALSRVLGRRAKRLEKPRNRRARPAGLEPATGGLEGRCSIHLSYGRSQSRA